MKLLGPLILITAFLPSLAAAADLPQVPWGEIREVAGGWELEISDAGKLPGGVVTVPRLNNPIGNVFLRGDVAKTPLQFRPQVRQWQIKLPEGARTGNQTVMFEIVGPPHVAGEARVVEATKVGVVTLTAHEAVTHGENLRYEPGPHKNTVGYWSNKDDWCTWRLQTERSGRYEVWLLQGCGKGHGGSEVALRIGEQELKFTVEETGHFQNFKHRNLGEITLAKPGQYTLELRPLTKAAGAVMDVRQVRLVPIPEP